MKKFAVIFLFLLSFFYAFFYTGFGLKLSEKLIALSMPGTLKIAQIDGKILSHIKIKNLSFKYAQNELSIGTLDIQWNFFQSIKEKKWVINQIIMDKFHWQENNQVTPHREENFAASRDVFAVNESKQETINNDLLQKMQWMKYIKVNLVKISAIKINYAEFQQEINQVNLLNNHGIYQLDLQFPQGTILGTCDLSFIKSLNWDLRLLVKDMRFPYLAKYKKDQLTFNLRSQGKIDQHADLMLTIDQLTGWVLNHAVLGKMSLRLHENQYLLNYLDLNTENSRIHISNKEQSHIFNFNLDIPKLQNFSENLSGKIYLNGYLSLDGTLPKIFAKIQAGHIKILKMAIQDIAGKIVTREKDKSWIADLTINNTKINDYLLKRLTSQIQLQQVNNKLLIQILLKSSNHDYMRAKLEHPHIQQLTNPKEKWIGHVELALKNLSSFIPKNPLKFISGQLTGNFIFFGNFTEQQYDGNLTLQHAQFDIRKLGVKLQNVFLTAHAKQQSPISFNGQFHSGKGSALLSGTINPDLFSLTLNVAGKNLTVLNLEDYQAVCSPQLQIILDQEQLNISGKLFFPFVKITPDQLRNVITLPAETVIIDQQETPLNLYNNNIAMKIAIILGKKIYISYKGLSAFLKGDLLISQLKGGLPSATGTLYIVDGHYKVYNQTLRIQNGRLIYLGNLLSNPGLNIQAIKSIIIENTPASLSSTYVGANIQGTLDYPQINLISNPPMKQDDILSYLIFGNPIANIANPNDLTILNSLASSLSLISPDSNGDGQLQKTIVSGFNLLGSIRQFNYRLNSYFSIQTKINLLETSMDLIYNYERD